MKSKLRGLFQVTGDVNVGKTSFALQSGYNLKQIAFFNFDGKEPDILGTDKPLDEVFGFYREYLHILNSELELAMIEAFLSDIKSVSKDIKVAIIDGEETFRKNFTPYTLKHKKKIKTQWYGKGGEWKAREELGFAKRFEATFFASLQQQFEQIFIINHLEAARDEDSEEKALIPGKRRSDIKFPLIRRTKARFWLVATEESLCPSALVVKNPGFQKQGESGIETVTLFPPKLSPLALPDRAERPFISLWDVIAHYEANPFSEKYPKVETFEMLTAEEREMVSEELTADDRKLMQQFSLVAARENQEMVKKQVKTIWGKKPNVPSAYIWIQVKKVLPGIEITKEQVEAILDELKGE